MEVLVTAFVGVILSASSEKSMALEELVAKLAGRDVVFLGEEHDNTEGHKAQLALIQALSSRRDDVVLSMEMFERDVQGVLNDYLQGRIDEDTFLKHSRPWSNYKKHYRPILEFARKNGWEVIAANAPRASARKIAKAGGDPGAFVARATTAPKDRYWELFKDAMKDHPGEITEESLGRMYAAQCLKDDTMAESIADFLQSHPHRKPLVVHMCGKFHSDYGLGTVVRLLTRKPLLQVGVVGMLTPDELTKPDDLEGLDRAHFTFVVKAEPKKEKKPSTDDEGGAETTGEKESGSGGGRPGLGVMPDYGGDGDGVPIADVREDGPAAKAGLKGGDIIVKMDGDSVYSLEDYMAVLSDLAVGQKVKVVVRREGKEKSFDVILGESHR